MPRPLFSIVMTVLNGGRTLEAFLASIAAQTCRDFELVIIDGGSTDSTLTIIERNRHVVTKFKQMPGIGIYAGLNAGIDRSEGEWLFFIGCDDLLYSPDTLEQVARTARAANVRLIAGSVQYTSGYVMTPRLGSPYLLRYRLHHQGTFYHRTIFDTYRYNEQLTISSDYELNTRLGSTLR